MINETFKCIVWEMGVLLSFFYFFYSTDLCNGDDSGSDSSSSNKKNFKRRDNSTTPPRGSKKSPATGKDNKQETPKTKPKVQYLSCIYPGPSCSKHC